jgi:hypothetical protein
VRARRDSDDDLTVQHQVTHPPTPGPLAGVWKAALSKGAADPTQQDWFLKGLQGGRAHPLEVSGVATLCCTFGLVV